MKVFLDTSVLLGGLIDFGPQSAAAQRLMAAIADGKIKDAGTGWHCCLECYSVVTRLPPEFRLTPADAERLMREEILARDEIAGGRVHDAHIAEIARAASAAVIVTDNRRHFLTALKHGLKVQTPQEFLAERDKP